MIPEDKKISQLIKSSAEGNTAAFRDIVRIYTKYLYALAFRILADEDDAKDIVQESWIRVWKHINEYDRNVKFTTWLYKIAVNLSYDRLKNRKRKMKVLINEDNLTESNFSSINSEQEYSNNELAGIIKNLSECLPDKQRLIFSLRDIQGFSIDEVAEVTGLSVASIKTNLVYARRNIRNKLAINYDTKDWK